MALLTHAAVEAKVLRRVHAKTATFGLEIEAPAAPTSDGSILETHYHLPIPPVPVPGASRRPSDSELAGAPAPPRRVDPDLIERLYREHVIPLTKVAEVQYLLQRLQAQRATSSQRGAPATTTTTPSKPPRRALTLNHRPDADADPRRPSAHPQPSSH